ncbi:MAG: alpha-(1-2)-phosphatidylinositol mannosyltransferase [Acidimicrobiales bacterium]|nr:MAG: alpha-(1-2)-phosphatidylinositol mannosyltransferase [Acidimicrobiales bacterium]
MSDSARGSSQIRGVDATLRIGMVCPYAFDSPGGVQAHVRELSAALRQLGHHVSVLAPVDDESAVPEYVESLGRTIPVRYNGSVARVAFGPLSLNRIRKWLRNGHFDVLHVHEPMAPSAAMLACLVARGPIVATSHVAKHRSRTVAAAHMALQPIFEKITGRIAVSALARQFQVEHFDGGGVEIPNGVAVAKFSQAEPLPGWPGTGGALGFLGRFNEPRKGFALLAEAFVALAAQRRELRLLVAGPGDQRIALAAIPEQVRSRVTMLGAVSELDKARMLRSVDVYVAPNLGGESFGMVLTEAMAAGAAVLASDLDAFRSVLNSGGQYDEAESAGELFRAGSTEDLARALNALLQDPIRRAALAARARQTVAQFDWPIVAAQVLEVYAGAIAAAPVRVEPEAEAEVVAAKRRLPTELVRWLRA